MARIPSSAGQEHPEAIRRAAIQRARADAPATPYRVRRVNRTRERSRAALLAAIPEGTRAAQHVAEWSRAAKAHPSIDAMRRDARARMHALIDHLAAMQGHRRGVCTVLVIWERLRPVLTDMTRRTVANYLRRLRESGLLCTVAGGRRAEHTPQRDRNEAPVYGLTVPKTPQDYAAEATTAPESVDTSFTPPPVGVGEDHVRAHGGEFSERSRFAAHDFERQRASRAAFHNVRAHRNDPLWPRHATVAWDEGGRATRRALRTSVHEMALSVQEHAPDARGASTAAVAAEIRPFVLSGWTVADVIHALDWSPEGARHWQAAQGMARIDLWMRRRLALWTRAGEPVRPFSATQADRAAQVRAEAEADRQRNAARRAEAATTIPTGPREALRAIFARNREERAAERHARALPVLS
ncbi:hypothetical protein ACWEOD_10150 [Micrococcus luteus]